MTAFIMETSASARLEDADARESRATARLTVDVDAIVANWRTVVSQVPPEVRAAGVLKSDAYGCGARLVLPALAEAGCRDFFVALIDEGLAVRDLLPSGGRLFVLSGPPAGVEEAMMATGLIPSLNSVQQLQAWAAAGRRRGTPAPAAWHVDTGMTRLGLDLPELAAAACDPELLTWAPPLLLMSHLACADEPAHPQNAAQAEAFRHARTLLPEVEASLGNSAGTFLGPTFQGDLVRPGAALYGINPTPGRPSPVRPVVRLEARILQVRQIDTPRWVGYGASIRLPAGRRIATVGVGYADGYPRAAGNQGVGVLAGIRVPVIGRVSMDLITLDVSAVPEHEARPGAMIDLLGADYTVDELAAVAGTIGYEILTRLGPRCPRRVGSLPAALPGSGSSA